MFDIGFPELLLIAIVTLLVIGPERLPETLRTLGLWFGRMRRSFTSVKTELEREIGMDEVRRQLHNEAVMEEMRRIEQDVRGPVDPGTGKPAEPADPSGDSTAAETPAEAPGAAADGTGPDEEDGSRAHHG
ncbi:MAG: Sec-independent protein translocase protein TatB [Pseudomonadota bacterium]